MNARTRSDILAAASGWTAQRGALTILRGAGADDYEMTEEGMRVALDALEFAIDTAREQPAPSREDLIRENMALKSKLDKIATKAAEIFDMTEDP